MLRPAFSYVRKQRAEKHTLMTSLWIPFICIIIIIYIYMGYKHHKIEGEVLHIDKYWRKIATVNSSVTMEIITISILVKGTAVTLETFIFYDLHFSANKVVEAPRFEEFLNVFNKIAFFLACDYVALIRFSYSYCIWFITLL